MMYISQAFLMLGYFFSGDQF